MKKHKLKIAVCGLPLVGKRTMLVAMSQGLPEPLVRENFSVLDTFVFNYRMTVKSHEFVFTVKPGSIFDVVPIYESIFADSDCVIWVDRKLHSTKEVDGFRKNFWSKVVEASRNTNSSRESKPWLHVLNDDGSDPRECSSLMQGDSLGSARYLNLSCSEDAHHVWGMISSVTGIALNRM